MCKRLFLAFALLFLGCSEESPWIHNDFDPSNIIGEWSVVRIKLNGSIFLEESKENNPIIRIKFQDRATFTGQTSKNFFKGTYQSKTDLLLVTDFSTSEVLDTDFGNKFYMVFEGAFNNMTNRQEFEYIFSTQGLLVKSNVGDELLLRIID
ncbi:MAG: hypothetical protein AAGC43_00065 [Bacteroidota bacterium]